MQTIAEISDLRALYGLPSELAVKKAMPNLDAHSRNFVRLSPFLLISTQGPTGADISPRGDPPGFVGVDGDGALLIPDRPGNNRIDTMENILRNPRVGLIFLVPGVGEALRINGRANIVCGPGLDSLAQNGRAPKTAIRVEIDEAFFHCAKALIRAKLWQPEAWPAKGSFPPLAIVIADQIAGVDAERLDSSLQDEYRTGLY